LRDLAQVLRRLPADRRDQLRRQLIAAEPAQRPALIAAQLPQ
jgi:hypothetical protein